MDSSDAYSDQNRVSDADVPVDPNRVEFQDSSEARSGLMGGARYKLMSPAKLPISRAACITIPPGLSPGSFLESPVLLTNMKAEPSPTTGTFIKSHMVHGYSSSGTYPISPSVFSNSCFSEEGKPSAFDFKPPMKANMVSADLNGHRSEQSLQAQVHGFGAPAELTGNGVNQSRLTYPEIQATELDQKGSGASMAAEKSSDDGYNWRKYGQKHVKGSEFPRSYYKCTYPNCEVKKLFERSHDGQITEIIYKGTHDHPKPQQSRRCLSSNIMSMQEDRTDKPTSLPGNDDKPVNRYSHNSHSADPNVASELSLVVATDDGIEGSGSGPSKNHDEADDDDPFSKKRRLEAGGFEVTPVIKPIREPRVVVQTLSEVDILDDGYRWRKYGQKVVRGNPNPRSYYKCTNIGCPVRKHVERASHDPKAVITTYEGKHNHDVPTAKSSSHDTAGPPSTAPCAAKFRAEEVHPVSLDLGVGLSNPIEHRSIDYIPGPGPTDQYELTHHQTQNGGSSFRVLQATPVSTHFRVLNGGMSQYGTRETEITPLNQSSYPFSQNIGRITNGP